MVACSTHEKEEKFTQSFCLMTWKEVTSWKVWAKMEGSTETDLKIVSW
jgi:hypothetical protein